MLSVMEDQILKKYNISQVNIICIYLFYYPFLAKYDQANYLLILTSVLS